MNSMQPAHPAIPAGGALAPKEAAIAGSINAAINGFISWGNFKTQPAVALTVDSISAGAHTALGSAVMMATALGLILTLVNFAVSHKHLGKPVAGRSLYGVAVRAAIGNALSLFGLLVVAGVVWQRVFGTLEVSPLVATLLVAGIAGGVSAWLAFSTRAAYLQAIGRA
jgi:hypothetical protein